MWEKNELEGEKIGQKEKKMGHIKYNDTEIRMIRQRERERRMS